MSTVHLVHGFNVMDGGKGTTDKLAPYFRNVGLNVVEHDYGWIWFFRVRLCNGTIAERVASAVRPGEIGCGHSNGCAILAEAARRGAPFKGLIFINPALDDDADVASQIEWVHVYHNRGDVPVRIAKMLFWHPWGDMGNHGYVGHDGRFVNFDCGPTVSGHSDIFRRLGVWGARIAHNAADAIWGARHQARGGEFA